MGLARQEREAAMRGQGCLGKARDDEPVFVLRAKDQFAPILVGLWVHLVLMAARNGLGAPSSGEKAEEADVLRHLMLDWQRANGCKVPD